MKNKKGQSVLEYAIVLSLVGAACAAMGMYVNRAVNSKLIDIVEQISPVQNKTTSAFDPLNSRGGGTSWYPWIR
jgi:hypothetical protein